MKLGLMLEPYDCPGPRPVPRGCFHLGDYSGDRAPLAPAVTPRWERAEEEEMLKNGRRLCSGTWRTHALFLKEFKS